VAKWEQASPFLIPFLAFVLGVGVILVLGVANVGSEPLVVDWLLVDLTASFALWLARRPWPK